MTIEMTSFGEGIECDHPKDAVCWNPFCKMVLCHRCGEQFWRPITHELNMKEFESEARKTQEWLDSEDPPNIDSNLCTEV